MITVFYANIVYDQYENWMVLRKSGIPNEVYQGGYVYAANLWENGNRWYRIDGTPVLDEDVPPELKAWVLIMEL